MFWFTVITSPTYSPNPVCTVKHARRTSVRRRLIAAILAVAVVIVQLGKAQHLARPQTPECSLRILRIPRQITITDATAEQRLILDASAVANDDQRQLVVAAKAVGTAGSGGDVRRCDHTGQLQLIDREHLVAEEDEAHQQNAQHGHLQLLLVERLVVEALLFDPLFLHDRLPVGTVSKFSSFSGIWRLISL